MAPPPNELAYILAEFPSVSETFILREMADLAARGLPLRVYALRAPAGGPVHADAAAFLDRVTYRPRPGSAECLARHLRSLARAPAVYLGLLGRAVLDSGGRPGRLRDRLVAFDAAVAFAGPLRANGTAHLHAHFASVPATAARYASTLLGIPYSFSAHAQDIYVAGRRDPAGLRANVAGAAFVVTCTEYNRAHLAALFPEAAGRIHLVYHGIEVERFGEREAEKRRGGVAEWRSGEVAEKRSGEGAAGHGAVGDARTRDDGSPSPAARERGSGGEGRPLQILAIGRLLPKKGLHLLIEACGLLREHGSDFRMVIAGDGPERGRLEALAGRHGIAGLTSLLGQLSQEEIVPLYHQSDLFALPCVVGADGDRDGLPNVLLEALAAGLPVVTTPVSGIPEVITDGETGLLVPAGDVKALAGALERLLGDADLRRRLGEAGRARVRRDFDLRSSPLAALFARHAGVAPAPRGVPPAGAESAGGGPSTS